MRKKWDLLGITAASILVAVLFSVDFLYDGVLTVRGVEIPTLLALIIVVFFTLVAIALTVMACSALGKGNLNA